MASETFLLLEELGVIMVYLFDLGLMLMLTVSLICLEKSELFILALTKSRVYKTLNIRVVYLKTRVRINLTLPRKRYLQKCPK